MPEIETNVVETKQVNVPILFVGTATVRLPHVHIIVQNPGDVAIVFSRDQLADLIKLLAYIQDESETRDFRGYLQYSDDISLSDSEREALLTYDDDEVRPILEKAAHDPSANHIWAIAQRVRELLP